ncbi:hypothetical protein [Bradyrhizobium sp. USDA 4452]
MIAHKVTRLALFVTVVMSSGISNAADFCSTLTAVANETTKGFKKFRGEDDGTGGYRTSVSLPGASECYIDQDDSSYNCEWQLAFSDDPDAQAKTFADGIKGCYPSASTSGGQPTKTGIHFFHRLNGVEFYVKSDPKKQRVRISIAKDE